MLKPLLSFASPGGRRGRLSVLVLHRVLAEPDPLYPEAMVVARFTKLCRWVGAMFTVLPFDTAIRHLRQGTLPERALVITFDDGYADNRHVAMPILQSLGLPATVFVSTGFMDGGCMWNDIIIESCRRTHCSRLDLHDLLPQIAVDSIELATLGQRRLGLEVLISAVKYFEPNQRLRVVRQIAERLQVPIPVELMLTSGDVLALRCGGMQIGAHTVTHPILARLSAEDTRREMKDSKDVLERLLGQRVTLFAYPNGKPGEDYNAQSVAMAKEVGFDAAVTTARGAATRMTDPFQIPRFTPWDQSRWRFGARMLSTLLSPIEAVPRMADVRP